MLLVRKRDGSLVEFELSKIIIAVKKAFEATDTAYTDDILERLALRVTADFQGKIKGNIVDIEDIQDSVEKILEDLGFNKVAKAYILYRKQREKLRNLKSSMLDFAKTVNNYLNQRDWRVKENSTVTYSIGGLILHNSGTVTANYWLSEVYDEEIGKAHQNGDFHIHDLSMLSGYCAGWSLRQLIEEGLGGVPGKVSSKPARHLSTLANQMVNFLGILQNEWAGAQAFSSFDTYLAPFVKIDNLTFKEVKQCIQSFVFGVNTPSRWGTQSPFSNITLDWTVPKRLKDEPAIVGGEPQDFTYGDCQKEMDIINRAFLEILKEGDANGRGFQYPIPTYNITKDFDWDNPNSELLFEITSKYGTPYFQNFINSDLNPDDVRSMCLMPEEVIFVRENGKIHKITIGEAFKKYRSSRIDSEWYRAKEGIEVLSLNPDNYRMEWVKVKNFLEIEDDEMVSITTKDGKTMNVSKDHLVAVYTESGIEYKKAKEITENDFLVVMKNPSNNIYGDYEIDERLAWLAGLFVADGNYLRDSREKYKGNLRGLQFSFNSDDKELIDKTKRIVKELFDYDMHFIQDPRYEKSLRGYIYSRDIASKFFNQLDIRKYERLPYWLWNSKKQTIKAFLNGFFQGDGYKDGKEIYINDKKLARELALLHQFAGISVTYNEHKNSQVIRIQSVNGRNSKTDRIKRDIMHKELPTFLPTNKYVRTADGKTLYQSYGAKLVGIATILKWNLLNERIEKVINADFAVVPVKKIERKKLGYMQKFYDVELEKNHYFVHSDGNITHNCCRLQLDKRELRRRGGGLFGSDEYTGSIGVVTINLPRLAYLSKNEVEFFKKLSKMMDLAKRSLEVKREVIEKLNEEGLYPYTKRYLKNFDNHFSTIGLVGMNEACLNAKWLQKPICEESARQFALRVLDFMRERLKLYQEETGNLYNLEATPAESTSYRLAKIDKNLFPDIITAGKDAPYYTNSTHLPVDYEIDIFSALELQEELQIKYTGGTVFHAFLGESVDDWRTTRELVKKIAENYRIPYFTISPTYSICRNHGYIKGEEYSCPICGQPTEVYSRITGYYRPVQHWNVGKQEEFKRRREFRVERTEINGFRRMAESKSGGLPGEGSDNSLYLKL